MSIVTLPGSPSTPPNVTDTIQINQSLVVASGEILRSSSIELMMKLGGSQTTYYGLQNAGEIWAERSSHVYLLDTLNFGPLNNSGLMVAHSTGGTATAIRVGSTWMGGLNNTGRIFAVSDVTAATAVSISSSEPQLVNSGLIAAVGVTSASAILRYNGGLVDNRATGEILAEGRGAIAVYEGRGNFAANSNLTDAALMATQATVQNAGRIEAVSTDASTGSVGVYLASLSMEFTKVVNTGLIKGDFAIYKTDSAFSSIQAGRDLVINEATGRLVGEIELGRGDDILINRGLIDCFLVTLSEGNDQFDNTGGVLHGVADMGWGDDRFSGGDSTDIVVGDRGNDVLKGMDGADLLLGGRGNDLIEGGAGRDNLYGEFGDDRIFSSGGDRISAGAGNDTVVLGDLSFADANGGQGNDTLVLPVGAYALDLSAALASNRLHRFESIQLKGEQEIVIRPSDVIDLSDTDRLVVSASSAGKVDLVGAWTRGLDAVEDGVSYTTYTASGATLWVSGGATVAILATGPSTPGLAPVAAGESAPLPGSAYGANLATSVTIANDFPIYEAFVIEADERWISTTGFAPISAERNSSLTNRGVIASNGPAGAVGLVAERVLIANYGTISASSAGGPSSLADLRQRLAQYGFDNIVANAASVAGVFAGGGHDGFLNTGLISATVDAGLSVGDVNWGLGGGARNDGRIEAVSTQFIAVGMYVSNAGTFTNTGEISATGYDMAVGFGASTHKLALTNSGSIVATAGAAGGQSIGIRLYYPSAEQSIVNSGVISAGTAIYSSGMINGGGVFVENSGTIIGDFRLNMPLQNVTATLGRHDTVDNSGSITGNLFLGGERDIYTGATGVLIGVAHGEGGADILIGGEGVDTLDGGDDQDAIAGGGGADVLSGGAGGDIFIFRSITDSTAAATDTISDFQAGVDRIDLRSLAPTSVVLTPSGGQTLLIATTAAGELRVQINGAISLSDVIVAAGALSTGTANADTLVATAGGGLLSGLAGDDVMLGSAAADRLDGGMGSDLMFGGRGDDYYIVEDGNDVVRELAGEGVDTIEFRSGGFVELTANVENLILVDAEMGYGNALDNVITGNSRNNQLDGAAGADTMIGGLGGDRYRLDDIGDVIVEKPGEGTDYAEAVGVNTRMWANVEWLRLVDGSAALTVLGSDVGDTIYGNGNNNTFWGGGGNDVLYGGLGIDAVYGDDGADELAGQAGSDVMYGGAGNDRLLGSQDPIFDPVIQGYRIEDDGAGDELYGGDGADILDGQDGDDILAGGQGADNVSGGNGADTLSAATDIASVTINLATGLSRDGWDTFDTISSIENIIGSAFGDTLTGNSGANVIAGGAGSDVMDGGAGVDAANYGTDVAGAFVQLAWGWARDGWGSEDRLSSMENIIGSGFNDVLISDTGDSRVAGGAGADWIEDVGGGNDNLSGEAGNDVVFGAADDDTLAGGDGDDALLGGIGNDTLDGGDGIDWIYGGLGADAIAGGAGNDILFGAEGGGAVSAGDLVDTLSGGDGDDALIGEAGDDALDGGAGADWAYGGEGDDSITGGLGNDVLAGENGNDTITGGLGDDFIFGGYGFDTLDGGAGNDWIEGSFGGARITGGAGADNLFGGDAATFVYTTTSDSTEAAADVIGIFWRPGGDKIDVSAIDSDGNAANGNGAFSFVSAFTNVAGQAVISYDGANSIARFDTNGDGVSDMSIVVLATQLQAADFVA